MLAQRGEGLELLYERAFRALDKCLARGVSVEPIEHGARSQVGKDCGQDAARVAPVDVDGSVTEETATGRGVQRLVLLDGVDLGEQRPHRGRRVSASGARLDEDLEAKGLL